MKVAIVKQDTFELLYHADMPARPHALDFISVTTLTGDVLTFQIEHVIFCFREDSFAEAEVSVAVRQYPNN